MKAKKTVLIAIFLMLIFTACSISNINSYKKDTNELVFYSQNKKVEKITLFSAKQKHYNNSKCVQNSYTLEEENKKYGKLFFEYISLDSSCTWTGLASGFFETSLNYELKLDSFEVVENIDINNYSFKTYKINNDSFVSVIYYYYGSLNTFLIDYEGKFYTNFLKKLKPDYKAKYLNKKRFEGNYNKSLARKNIIESYFSTDKEFIN